MLTRAQITELKKAPAGSAPNRVALAMELADVTQMDVQAGTGIPQSYVSRIRRGRYSRLPGETMRTLATFFGCHIEDLFPSREAVAS